MLIFYYNQKTTWFKLTLIANIRHKKDYYFGEAIKIGKPCHAIIESDIKSKTQT